MGEYLLIKIENSKNIIKIRFYKTATDERYLEWKIPKKVLDDIIIHLKNFDLSNKEKHILKSKYCIMQISNENIQIKRTDKYSLIGWNISKNILINLIVQFQRDIQNDN